MTKDEALKLAMDWYGSGNQDPDEFERLILSIVAQPEQEPVAIKHMAKWVEYLKRQSDHGQHLRIPSGMSAGTCWDLARELEQFINTTPPQRKPLPKGEWPKHPSGYVGDVYKGYDKSDLDNYAMQVLAAHGIKE